jgi:hypothetical protein
MSNAPEPVGLLEELERAERVLDGLLQQLSRLYANLEPIESALRVSDFSSSGMYIPGLATGIVCALTADIKGDPLHNVLVSLKGKGLKLPAIIKGSDRSETPATCESIMKIIRARFDLKATRMIVNLRWSPLPAIMDKENTVIIGTRYFHGNVADIMKFRKRLEELKLEVFEDNGEFGGGLLTYKLMNFIRDAGGSTVLELTLSTNLSENAAKIAEILEAIATNI